MCSIYSNATSTIIYIGDPSDLSRAAFKRFFAAGAFSTNETNDILSRPWFTRVWVFQEAVVSMHPWVYCGQDRLPWGKFRGMLSTTISSTPTPYHNRPIRFDNDLSRYVATHAVIGAINRARDLYHTSYRHDQFELLELLMQRKGFAASDPRDIVYALTAVAPSIRNHGTKLDIDYTKTCEEVYNETVAWILVTRNDYRILAYADTSDGYSRSGIPASWATDWRQENYYDTSVIEEISTHFPGKLREASVQVDFAIDCGKGILACRGERPWDVIRYVSATMTSTLTDEISLPIAILTQHFDSGQSHSENR